MTSASNGSPAGPAGDERPDERSVEERAALLPEEVAAGSADPEAQARAVLEESLERTESVPDDPAAPDTVLEHRRSADTV